MSHKYKKRELDQSCYALYRGDEFLDLGTLEYLSKTFGFTRKTLHFYKSPTYKKRIRSTSTIVIKIDNGGEIYE